MFSRMTEIKSSLTRQATSLLHRRRSQEFRAGSTRLDDDESDPLAARVGENDFRRHYYDQLSWSLAISFGL